MTRYFLITIGLLGAEYSKGQLLMALRDLRELIAVGGFSPELYGVDEAGDIRRFVPASRTWSAPLAEHPIGPQAKVS